MAQHRDARVLVDLLDDGGTHLLRTDWIALAIDGALRHDDDVQPLASITFLFVEYSQLLDFFDGVKVDELMMKRKRSGLNTNKIKKYKLNE